MSENVDPGRTLMPYPLGHRALFLTQNIIKILLDRQKGEIFIFFYLFMSERRWASAWNPSVAGLCAMEEYKLSEPQSTHRVAFADFWYTSHHDGKISPGWWGGGVHAHPLSAYYHHVQSCSVRSSWEGRYTTSNSCRTNPWSAVPDWAWYRNFDVGLTQLTTGLNADAGLTFLPKLRHSGIYMVVLIACLLSM